MDHIFEHIRQRFRGLVAGHPAGLFGVEHEDGQAHQALRLVRAVYGLIVSLKLGIEKS